jgi:hypothetical protein
LPKADPTTIQRLRVKLQQAGGGAEARQKLIDTARDNGVDASEL